MEQIKAVIGLGNPGNEYRLTRHNIGFMVIRALQKRFPIVKKRTLKGMMQVINIRLDQTEILTVRPLTYMNRSGLAARMVTERYHLQPQQMLVVYDDLDLPLGQMRLRHRGGAGSHRGMADIIQLMGTDRIPRLRLGIGGEEPPADRAGYVLSPFSTEEWPRVHAMIDRAVNVIMDVVHQGIEPVMSIVNARE